MGTNLARAETPTGRTDVPRAATLRVVAADATPLTRLGLHSLVEQAPDWQWLGSAEETRGVLLVVARHHPDVLLLDSSLDPDAALTHALHSRHPRLKIVLLVREHQHDHGYLRQLRQAGASVVLPRNAPLFGLLETVRQAGDREGGTGHSTLTPAPHFARSTPATTPELSPREQQVLYLITRGHHNEDIAHRLYISIETVRTHVKAILRKLEVGDRAHAVARAYTLGILAISTPEPMVQPSPQLTTTAP